MKRVILSGILFFGSVAYASAQSSGSTGSSTGSGASTSTSKSSANKKPSDSLDNRKIYHFKDGQRATPTGAEATPSSTSGGFAAIGKDTTPKVATDPATNNATKKPVANKKNRGKRNA